MTVAVVGAGVIGLATAFALAERGYPVTVYDPAPGSGASTVAAGMLAPVGEAGFGEDALTRLLVEGARRWPAFAARLSAAAGMDVGYRDSGSLLVARTADDLAEVRRLCAHHESLGLASVPLRAGELREREPLLAPGMRGGALLPEDHQVDPRRVVAALLAAIQAAGVRVVRRAVADLSTVEEPVQVLAAGWRSGPLAGLPVRPVKGQLLRLRGTGLRHVIRGYVDGRRVYLVPRADGEVVVGATSEERGDTTVTAGAVRELLCAAVELVPELAEYELVEARAGLRPGTPDNAPVIGEVAAGAASGALGSAGNRLRLGSPRVFVATGHYRHGVLLAPLTADAVADLVSGRDPAQVVKPFGPERWRDA
jgi:glycine oxidase